MTISLRRERQRRRLCARTEDSLTVDAVLHFLRTARSHRDDQDWPLLVDARGATTVMNDQDAEAAAAIVRQAIETDGLRAPVAIAADDDRLYRWFLLYESKCGDAGARMIRTFRELADAERWLDIVSAARRFG